MKSAFILPLLAFYFLGTLLLPLGDFSIMPDLPKMYAHCRDTEDKDMDVFEFVTEHLSGLSQVIPVNIFEDDLPEPGDKPHAPVQFHFQIQVVDCRIATIQLPADKPVIKTSTITPVSNDPYLADYCASLFRPPIV